MDWGFLRETTAAAEKAGIDKHTGICRTGLDKYLEVIYPGSCWLHNMQFGEHNGKIYHFRPDYRSDHLKIVIEFDGTLHYSNPDNIRGDKRKDDIYNRAGYRVIRIPYFIQLTRTVVKQLFGVDVQNELFPNNVASMSIVNKNTPAYMCKEGVKRMAMEFQRFPEQYEANVQSLQKEADDFLTGVSFLIEEYNKLKSAEANKKEY